MIWRISIIHGNARLTKNIAGVGWNIEEYLKLFHFCSAHLVVFTINLRLITNSYSKKKLLLKMSELRHKSVHAKFPHKVTIFCPNFHLIEPFVFFLISSFNDAEKWDKVKAADRWGVDYNGPPGSAEYLVAGREIAKCIRVVSDQVRNL